MQFDLLTDCVFVFVPVFDQGLDAQGGVCGQVDAVGQALKGLDLRLFEEGFVVHFGDDLGNGANEVSVEGHAENHPECGEGVLGDVAEGDVAVANSSDGLRGPVDRDEVLVVHALVAEAVDADPGAALDQCGIEVPHTAHEVHDEHNCHKQFQHPQE